MGSSYRQLHVHLLQYFLCTLDPPCRRIGEVSKLFADTGVVTLVSFISPYKADRERVRQRLQPGQFIEVFMKVPLAVCETRDPKGLYKKARAGICHKPVGGGGGPSSWGSDLSHLGPLCICQSCSCISSAQAS